MVLARNTQRLSRGKGTKVVHGRVDAATQAEVPQEPRPGFHRICRDLVPPRADARTPVRLSWEIGRIRVDAGPPRCRGARRADLVGVARARKAIGPSSHLRD